MVTSTTDFWLELLRTFPRSDCQGIDFKAAGLALGVAPSTVKRWRAKEPPRSIKRCLYLYRRAIPDAKDWDGFWFADNQLYTPFKGLSFRAVDLLHIFYERQFSALDQAEKAQLKKQLATLRNDEERLAIVDEIDAVIQSLNSIKCSPLLVKHWHGALVKRT